MVDVKEYFRVPKEKVNDTLRTIIKVLPIMAFVPAFLILYSLYPANFEVTWKGRLFYVIFIWLASLEIIISWENLTNRIKKLASARNAVFITSFFLPTAYVIISNFFGLNTLITNWSQINNVGRPTEMPLSIEYLIFASFFVLLVWSEFGFAGFKESSISLAFLATIGIIYTIDTLYPAGTFTPFQVFVPTTSTLAANFLNMMGYRASFLPQTLLGTPILQVQAANGVSATFGIAWPCSGIESILIYTVTILVFLKKSTITLMHRIAYFAVGAIVTYFINILRIATIFIIQINTGGGNTLTPQAQDFHNIYGGLYSIMWILSYTLIIMGSELLSSKFKT